MMLGIDMVIDGREYVTIAEAAKLAGVTSGRIRQIASGKTKRFNTIKIGKSNLVPLDELNRWIEDRKPGRPGEN